MRQFDIVRAASGGNPDRVRDAHEYRTADANPHVDPADDGGLRVLGPE
jgi:hypothetical protein